jgi:hypothetical protein
LILDVRYIYDYPEIKLLVKIFRRYFSWTAIWATLVFSIDSADATVQVWIGPGEFKQMACIGCHM